MADLSSSNIPDVVQFPSGTKQWFYQPVAPTGWTIDVALGDAVLAVHGTSTYDGSSGGGEQRGIWTQPNHVHTGTTDTETCLAPNVCSAGSNSHYHTFTTDGSATVNTWRPKANVGIIATKD
jgi:hypothetical protein